MEDNYWINQTLAEFRSSYDMVYGKKSPGAKINKNHIPLKNVLDI